MQQLDQCDRMDVHVFPFDDYLAAHEHDAHVMLALWRGRRLRFEDIEALQQKIAERLGYRLVGHRLELYGVPAKKG
jgi:Fur family ferric uptake transcriptional regulator